MMDATKHAGTFRAILADPPWRFRTWGEHNQAKSPSRHYALMTQEEINALPVAALAHPEGCALTMWCVAPMIPHALQTLEAWGFAFKTMGAWAKQSSTGAKWAFGTGYCYRSAAEFFILGTRGKPKPQSKSIRNLIVSPVREHSRKPDQMRSDIEALWNGPYCELFARQTAPNWSSWGNQMDKFNPAIMP